MEPLDYIRSILSDPATSALFSGACFLAGLLLGNWIAIGRDKRKKFNDAAAVVREAFLLHRQHLTPYYRPASLVAVDSFEQRLASWRRRGFRQALKRYEDAQQAAYEQDAVGEVYYSETADISRCLDTLLAYTRQR